MHISKMKVIAIPEVYLYDLSPRMAVDAARFFSLVDLFPSKTNVFHNVIRGCMVTN